MNPDWEALYRDLRKPRVTHPTRRSYLVGLTPVAAPTDPLFDTCQVCWGTWAETHEKAIVNTGCSKHGHYHRDCLLQWLQNSTDKCPHCRQVLYLDCCAKVSRHIPVTHTSEVRHTISIANLFGYPASAYCAVLAVYSDDHLDSFGDATEVTSVRCTIEPDADITLDLPEPNCPTTFIIPDLNVRITDASPSILAFIRLGGETETIRIVYAWGILLLAFRLSEDLEADEDTLMREQDMSDD